MSNAPPVFVIPKGANHASKRNKGVHSFKQRQYIDHQRSSPKENDPTNIYQHDLSMLQPQVYRPQREQEVLCV